MTDWSELDHGKTLALLPDALHTGETFCDCSANVDREGFSTLSCTRDLTSMDAHWGTAFWNFVRKLFSLKANRAAVLIGSTYSSVTALA